MLSRSMQCKAEAWLVLTIHDRDKHILLLAATWLWWTLARQSTHSLSEKPFVLFIQYPPDEGRPLATSSLARSLRGLTYSTLKFMRSTCGKSMCQVALHVLNIKMFCTLEISDDLSRKSDSNIKWHWKTLVNSPEQYCSCVGMEEAWIVWVGEGHTITVCVGWTVDTVSSLHFGSVKKSSEKLLDNDHKNVNQNSWIPNQV